MKRILEIGSGHGFYASILSKNRNNRVYAIDLSEENISIAKKRYPHIQFQVMNAEKLKFEDNFFDEIYALEVFEHVDKLDEVISEVKRVLKEKGKLIVSIPHHKSERWLLKIRPTYFKEIHHVRIFEDNELEKRLSKKRFRLSKKQYKGFIQHAELFFLFKRKNKKKKQTSIADWRENYVTRSVHAFFLLFDPLVLKTSLVYFPIWVVTIPIGYLINFFGNKVFPKGIYYEFVNQE